MDIFEIFRIDINPVQPPDYCSEPSSISTLELDQMIKNHDCALEIFDKVKTFHQEKLKALEELETANTVAYAATITIGVLLVAAALSTYVLGIILIGYISSPILALLPIFALFIFLTGTMCLIVYMTIMNMIAVENNHRKIYSCDSNHRSEIRNNIKHVINLEYELYDLNDTKNNFKTFSNEIEAIKKEEHNLELEITKIENEFNTEHSLLLAIDAWKKSPEAIPTLETCFQTFKHIYFGKINIYNDITTAITNAYNLHALQNHLLLNQSMQRLLPQMFIADNDDAA